jgi:hypothetical protein
VLQTGIERCRICPPLKPANVAAAGGCSRRAMNDRRDAGHRTLTTASAGAAVGAGSVELLSSLNTRIARELNVEEINNWLRQQNVRNRSVAMVLHLEKLFFSLSLVVLVMV